MLLFSSKRYAVVFKLTDCISVAIVSIVVTSWFTSAVVVALVLLSSALVVISSARFRGTIKYYNNWHPDSKTLISFISKIGRYCFQHLISWNTGRYCVCCSYSLGIFICCSWLSLKIWDKWEKNNILDCQTHKMLNEKWNGDLAEIFHGTNLYRWNYVVFFVLRISRAMWNLSEMFIHFFFFTHIVVISGACASSR